MENIIKKIQQYRQGDDEGKLFKSDDVQAEAIEILRAYDALQIVKYQLTQQDLKIRGTAQIFAQSDLVEEIRRRTSSDPKDGLKPSDLGIEGLDD